MAFLERFSQIVKGDLIFLGNSLGLSKKENQNTAGKVGSIGTFTTIDSTEQVPTFPNGTSLDYLKNSSSAVLNLPPDSQILYAELIWSGIYKSKTLDISSALSKPISLTTSKGKYDIGAEYRTKQDCIVNLNGVSLSVYVRTANVTELIQKGMSGTYTVGKIPTIIAPDDSESQSTNFAGWTLAIAYKNDRMSPKKLNLKVGCEAVYSNTENIDIPFAGFEIPKNGVKNAKLFLSAGEGDADIDGDSAFFGESENTLFKLKSDNNLENNFFASQINDSNGKLDTSGTFGTRNQLPFEKSNVEAGRQGWDIACVDISKNINSNFKSSIIRFSSKGDLYFPNAIGLSIDSLGANLQVEKSADKETAVWGDTICYTVTIKNTGDTIAENVVLYDCIPKGLTFSENSIKVDGNSYRGKFPIVLSNMSPYQFHTVSFKMKVSSKQSKLIKNIANVSYYYTLSSGEKIRENSNSNISCITPEGETNKLKISKFVDKSMAAANDILTYKNIIENISNNEISQVAFFDNIPLGTEFVPESVLIDGQKFSTYNPVTGFVIGSLNIGQKIEISFQVKII